MNNTSGVKQLLRHPKPSMKELARQLRIDIVSEPYLMNVLEEMRNTPLPPTWFVFEARAESTNNSPPNHTPTLEYVNRFTGARTGDHPGAQYFLGIVENERKMRGKDSPKNWNAWKELSLGSHQESQEGTIDGSEITEEADMNSKLPASEDSLSEFDSCIASGKPPEVAADGTRRQMTRKRGKYLKRQPPKFLAFTCWWHETKCGTENIVNRKHASIRYETITGAFEVEVDDMLTIVRVSHATGRYGKVTIDDIHVGAQISILGRKMRLMQCDGATAQWLESEVRAINNAKSALIAALERRGENVRVMCRSDRAEENTASVRGGYCIGHAASLDRRVLRGDVRTLHGILAEYEPEEARKLTQGVL